MKNYQEIFNQTLTKIRYAVSGAVENDSPLMRTIVKVMYDFTDDLIENGIIEDRGQGKKYENKKETI